MRSFVALSTVFAIIMIAGAVFVHLSGDEDSTGVFGVLAFLALVSATAAAVTSPDAKSVDVGCVAMDVREPAEVLDEVRRILVTRGISVTNFGIIGDGRDDERSSPLRFFRALRASRASVVVIDLRHGVFTTLAARAACAVLRVRVVALTQTRHPASPFLFADRIVPIGRNGGGEESYVLTILGKSTQRELHDFALAAIERWERRDDRDALRLCVAGAFDDFTFGQIQHRCERMDSACFVERADSEIERAELMRGASKYVAFAGDRGLYLARSSGVVILGSDGPEPSTAESLVDLIVKARDAESDRPSLRRLPLIVAIFALTWPFLSHAGSFLAIRYFDANTTFGPLWMTARLFHGWDEQEHLGYSHSREFAYLSIQQLLSALLTPLGADLRNRLSLVATQCAIFGAMLAYVRVRRPKVGSTLQLLSAYFYAANPFVVAFVHDGYSGLLVDYALLPAVLLILEWGKRTNRPATIAAIPLVFLAGGMYTLTGAVISMIGIGIVEGRWILRSLRESRNLSIAIALCFGANLAWFVPTIVSILLVPPPLLQESAGDIAILTAFGSLTNASLLRSYPELSLVSGNGIAECTACRFYSSPYYELAMAAIVIGSLVALWRCRHYLLFWSTLSAICLTTGFRYRDELIGLPYDVVMHLPTFDTFRSSVKFTALVAFFVSLGILEMWRSVRLLRPAMLGLSTCVVVIAQPYWSGGIIEATTSKEFPNFVVTIPEPYGDGEAMGALRSLVRPTETALVVPNFHGGISATTWGQYGNDVLPGLLQRPTLIKWYVTQPNPALDPLIDTLDGPISSSRAQSLLRSLGIDWTLVRRDVQGADAPDPTIFGKVRFDRGEIIAARRTGVSFDRYFSIEHPVPITTLAEHAVINTALYAGIAGLPAVEDGDSAESNEVCSGQAPLAFAIEQTDVVERAIDVDLPCSGSFVLTTFASATSRDPFVRVGKSRLDLRPVGSSGTGYAIFRSGPVTLNARETIRLIVGKSTDAPFIEISRPGKTFAARREAPSQTPLGLFFAADTNGRYIIFNKSWDRALAGVGIGRSGLHLVDHPVADGFANAWFVAGGDTLWVFDAVAATAVVSSLVSVAFLFLAWRLLRPRRARRSVPSR